MVSADECDFNLAKPGCLEFCSNPENKCNDDSKVQYCVGKFHQNKIDYPRSTEEENVPSECECLLMGPRTRLEKKLDLVNHGNRACWSPYCRDGTSPKLNKLSKSSWWLNMERCAAINFCNIDMGDTIINQYDDSVLQIQNCSEEEFQNNAHADDLQNLEQESSVSVPDNVIDSQKIDDDDDDDDDDVYLWIGGLVLFILFVLALFFYKMKKRRNLKKSTISSL
jgi:hypothetical protein